MKMLWIALYLAIGAKAAFAQSAGEATTAFLPSPVERAEWELGTLSVRNLVSDFYGQQSGEITTTFAIATPLGDVAVAYTRTRNDSLDPSDLVTILSAPEGYLAVPAAIRVDEDATVAIRLVRFQGV
jgi:hypothetical protein